MQRLRRTWYHATIWMSLAAVLLLLSACNSATRRGGEAPEPLDVTTEMAPEEIEVVTGQLIYVPAYSEIYFTDATRTLDLSITLSIHNTDLAQPIILRSVRYYNNGGTLIKEYVPNALQLPPIATKVFVIEIDDTAGGVGANFLVEWVAEESVTAPVVEAVHISTEAQQGLSFLSPGRVVRELTQ